jgi:radical SAM superfamily enzyme YgiQ (UPF0313 family)
MAQTKSAKIVLYNPPPAPPRHPVVRAPLALISISTLLTRENYEIVIVDRNLYPEPIKKVVEEAGDAICLGITGIVGVQVTEAIRLAKVIRSRYPKLPIVWGGRIASLMPEETVSSPYADIVVRGQGERTFTELVHTLEEGKPLENILGISYKRDGKIIHNPERPLEDLNNFPSYPYHLIDVERVIFQTVAGARTLNYVASYGCPWRCGFCSEMTVYKRRWLTLNPYRMAEEIEKLVKDHKLDAISFDDNEFFISKERVRIFCEETIRRGVKINWHNASGRIPQLIKWEDELWELFVQAGCRRLGTGAESGYQPALDLIHKDMLVGDTLAFAERARKHNIKVTYSMLTGLPWDTNYEKTRRLNDIDLEATVDLCDKLIKLDHRSLIAISHYTPYPGSPLFQRSLELGLKPPTSLEGWAKWVQELSNTPWYFPNQEKKLQVVNYVLVLLDSEKLDGLSMRIHNPVVRFLFRQVFKLFELIAKLRWRHRFFSLPLDYWLFLLARELLAIG